MTDKNLCKNQMQLDITVFNLPTVTVPSSLSVCAESILPITANVFGGTPAYFYSWTQNNKEVGTAGSLGFINNVAGVYTVSVQVTDKNTCKASASSQVTVKELPPFQLPKTAHACSNQKLTLDINPNKAPVKLTVTWKGDIQTLDLTNPIAPVFKAAALMATPYTLIYTVDNGNLCPKTDTIVVTAYPVPLVRTPDTLKVCLGSTIDIEGVISGSNPSILWEGNGYVNPIQGVSTSTFTASKVGPAFPVIVSASLNEFCSAKDTTIVVVNDVPQSVPGLYPDVPFGGQIDLLGSALKDHGTPQYIGKWIPFDLILSETAATKGFGAHTKSLVSMSNNFGLVTTDKNGCKDTAYTLVKVTDGISFDIPEDSTNRVADPKLPIDPKDYPKGLLNYSHSDNICEGETVTILTQFYKNGSGDYTYSWTANNDPTFKSSNTFIKVSPVIDTKYTLKVIDNKYPTAIIAPQEFTLYVHQNPKTKILSDKDVFNGLMYVTQPVILNGNPSEGTKPYTSLWTGDGAFALDKKNNQFATFTSLVKKEFSVTYKVTDANGCTASDTKVLNILGMDTIKVNYRSVVCGDGSISLYQITSTSNPNALAPIYNWTIEPTTPFTSTNDAIYVAWDKPGIYKITVEDINPNSSPKVPATFTVRVYPPLVLTGAIQGPQDVCENERANYNLDLSVFNPSTDGMFMWHVKSNDDYIKTSPYADKMLVKWGSYGTDEVYIVGSNGGDNGKLGSKCRDSVYYPVTIHKLPTPDFYARSIDSVKDKQIYANHVVDYDNRSYLYSPLEIDQKALRYYWDFVGDGVYVEDKFEPKYSYDEKGVYPASLIAMDPVWGCRDTVIKQVVVVQNPHCAIKFPNAFTPEAKNDNGFSYGYSEGLVDKDYNLQIFNRWGQLLWETNSRTDKWDGTFKGEVCKQDVYVYHNTATCENGQVLKTNGDVTLIK